MGPGLSSLPLAILRRIARRRNAVRTGLTAGRMLNLSGTTHGVDPVDPFVRSPVPMHVVIRKYTATPDVLAEARPKLADLEATMRGLPGFVAYYFVETDGGLATITIAENEAGTAESMRRAAEWVQQNLQTRASLSAPEVTQGQTLINATR